MAPASLINIPGHEGISEDLEPPGRHNARIRWLHELVQFAAKGTPPPPGSCSSRAYARARIDALARMLVAGDEAAPSPGTPLMEPAREALLADVRARLEQMHGAGAAQLDHYDVSFQPRRAFFFLYLAKRHQPLRLSSIRVSPLGDDRDDSADYRSTEKGRLPLSQVLYLSHNEDGSRLALRALLCRWRHPAAPRAGRFRVPRAGGGKAPKATSQGDHASKGPSGWPSRRSC